RLVIRQRLPLPAAIRRVLVLPAALPGGVQAGCGDVPGVTYEEDHPACRHRLGEQRRAYGAVGLLYDQVTALRHLGKARVRFAEDEGLDGIEPAPFVIVPENVVLDLLMARGTGVVQVAEELPDQRLVPHFVALDLAPHRAEPGAAATVGAEKPDDVLGVDTPAPGSGRRQPLP